MPAAPFAANETQRLAILSGLAILDTPAEERFDRITRTAQRMFDMPIVLVSLVDANRQWFKSCLGLGLDQTDRRLSFCAYAILDDGLFVIPDATRDPRFADNALVTGEPHIRFYAGYPLAGPDGSKLGTLCMIDRRPRELSQADRLAFRDLAAWAELELSQVQSLRRQVVAQRRQADEALRQAREEAERANRAKSEFLSRMSHELRTPMNAILGFGQILETEDLSAGERESVEHILRAGQHLLGLIDEVLDIARIEEGRMRLELEPVRAGDLIDESLDLVYYLAARRNLRIDTAVEAVADLEILADRQRTRQILLNLLSNAVKYNRPGGSVTIAVDPPRDGRLCIRVSDTGEGIPAEKLARVFMPFDRLGAEQSSVEGTGLGLAICKRLVEAMGGAIGVDSVVGQGSTFWIELPMVPGVSRKKGTTPLDAAPLTGRYQTLLYVEDNLQNLQLIERSLKKEPNINLIAAMSGELGLEIAREQQPDLILLDLHLPDIQGEDVLRRLQANPQTRHIPIVVVSAGTTEQHVRRLLANGARAYLTEPINLKRFMEVLVENLGRPGSNPAG